uniref:hypothetical protein n=1 Tax=Candidatus Desulfosporosinus nitrosoreducens TaxID=3401928 RepID=UPI00280C0377|nr:hypothetical protein [Desulfosporosinus sp. PR]
MIAKLGYSHDHRPDREQIVIALMVTPQGPPFYWRRISKTISWIAEQNAKLALSKKSRQKEAVERKVQKIISKRKLKSLMKVSVTPIEVKVLKKDG